MNKCYRTQTYMMSLLSCPWEQQLSRDAAVDAADDVEKRGSCISNGHWTEFYTVGTAFACLEQTPFIPTITQAMRRKQRYRCNPLATNTRKRWVASTTLQLLYPLERPGNHYTRGWVSFGADMDGTEKVSPTKIQTLDRRAHTEYLPIPITPPRLP
jgi:hypothetical protein